MSSPLHTTPPERIAALHLIRDRHCGHTGATQRARLRDALETLGSVTTFEAMRFLDIFDPRPRKLELVRDGMDIFTLRRSDATESGERHSIGVYVLRKGGCSMSDAEKNEGLTVAAVQAFGGQARDGAQEFASTDSLQEATARMKVRAAQWGCSLHEIAGGGFLLCRWGHCKEVPCLRAVGALLRRIGGQHG